MENLRPLIVFKKSNGDIVQPLYFSSDYSMNQLNRFSSVIVPFGARIPKPLPNTLLEKACKDPETINEDDLEQVELQELIRFGVACPSVAKIIWEKKGLRCVHLLPDKVLYPHQWEGIRWMNQCERNPHHGITGGILEYDMGLGKSITSVYHSLLAPKEKAPTLIICSKTLAATHWPKEIRKFFDSSVNVFVLTRDELGSKIDQVTYEMLMASDIVITTYDQCRSACKKGKYYEYVQELGEKGYHKDKVIERHNRTLDTLPNNPKSTGLALIYEIPWTRVICDESQTFTSFKSKTFEAMLAIYGKYKWCLSGTTTRNYKTDIWSQLFFCGYNLVTQPKDWAKRYNEYLFSHDLRTRIMSVDYASTDIQMPALEKVEVLQKFSHNEASVYEAILTLATETLEDFLAKRVKWAALLVLFCALRKSCVCSYLGITKGGSLSEKQLKEVDHLQGINKWVVQRDQEAGLFCTKFNAVVNLVIDGEPDDIFLVFSAFAESLKLLIERLELEKIIGDLFIGEMKYDARIECLNRFRRGETKVLCLTFKVGSEGLNLTEANKIIFLDLWWNEATLSQATNRAWRLGQSRKVTVYKLMFERSIEVIIQQLCHDKGNLARFVKTGEKQGKATYAGLGKQTLEKLLRTGVAERKKNGINSKDSDDYRRFFEKHCVSERTYLDILEFGNTEQPTIKEISKRFRTLMRRYHPDKLKGKEDMAQKLSEAYTTLQEIHS